MALDISLNVRPNVPPELFELFEECGVRHITIGFEALSTGALNVMNKGTQAIDVLYMLKKCEQHGIRHDGKLICHHPGVPPADLEVQLRNLEFAKWYAPLQPNAFQLIAGSAIHAAPSEFGVSEVGNHPSYRPLMPDWAFEGLDLFRKHFVDHNRATTYPLWNRIEARLLAWAAAYHRLRSVDDTPLLRACATGSSLEIRSRELVGDEVLSKTLRLTEQAARLYRACDVPVRRDELASSTGTSAAEVSAVLDKLVESRVVFREGERYLALAIEDGGRR